MAAIGISTTEHSRTAEKPRLVALARAAFRHLVRLAEERRTIVQLARMSPRMLEDMGFDPASIYGAVEGTWEEADTGRFYHP